MVTEKFQPVSNTPPIGFAGKLKFYGRMLLDLQILTIYKDIKKKLPAYSGNILDIGCGQSPYKFLLNKEQTHYHGIDIVEACDFGYNNTDITSFNGKNIPFADNTFDAVICTEVLEHVEEYQFLVDEIYRTTKINAEIFVTVPWSARYHYIPYDYFRYTPSSLQNIFCKFSEVIVQPRGNDIAVIGSKIIVLYFRNFFPQEKWRYIFLPFFLATLPILLLAVLIAQLAIFFGIGSTQDPLGYTIFIKK